MKHFGIIVFLFIFHYCAFTQADSTQADSTQSFILKGTIVDGNSNELLMGSNILVNNDYGTKTNYNGEFTLKVKENDSLTISFIGYKSLHYIIPHKASGNYLTKFKLYKDSISLNEVEIFPYPTYEEFQEAFFNMDKQDEQIAMAGVKMYQDRIIHETYDMKLYHIFSNPISLIYDKLFDKKAKLNRKLDRRRNTIEKETMISE